MNEDHNYRMVPISTFHEGHLVNLQNIPEISVSNSEDEERNVFYISFAVAELLGPSYCKIIIKITLTPRNY